MNENINDLGKDVWILVEVVNNEITPLTRQLMSIGQVLASESGESLCLLLVGSFDEAVLGCLQRYNVKEIHYCNLTACEAIDENILADNIINIVQGHSPNILLVSSSVRGRALAPRVAAKLRTGLTADCLSLKMAKDNKRLLVQSRPAFGGSLIADIVCEKSKPQMATVREGIYQEVACEEDIQGRLHEHRKVEGNSKLDFLFVDDRNMIKAKKTHANRSITLACGSGVKKHDDFLLIEKLACLIDAELVVTRPLVERGWADKDKLVGHTGRVIETEVYLALGISGALQHMSGVKAQKIIAVNKDPEASVFNYAHYGVVSDLMHVVNQLLIEVSK